MLEFTQDQRRRLRNLGVTEAQLNELECVALPIGRAWLRSPPMMRDVRSELQALSNTMKAARHAMSRLLDEAALAPAQREAAGRVDLAIFEARAWGNGQAIEKALDAVVLIHDAAEKATREMPQEQRRNKAASMIPVRLIVEALSSGFAKGHQTALRAKQKAAVPGFFKPSSSPSSAFREIVGICYEAMNQGRGADPERAIKAYIAAGKQAQHDSETGTAGGQKS